MALVSFISEPTDSARPFDLYLVSYYQARATTKRTLALSPPEARNNFKIISLVLALNSCVSCSFANILNTDVRSPIGNKVDAEVGLRSSFQSRLFQTADCLEGARLITGKRIATLRWKIDWHRRVKFVRVRGPAFVPGQL